MATDYRDWTEYALASDVVLDGDWELRGALPASRALVIVADARGQSGRALSTEGVGTGATVPCVLPDTSTLNATVGEIYMEFSTLSSDTNQNEYVTGGCTYLTGGVVNSSDLNVYYGFTEPATSGPRPAIYRIVNGTALRIARQALQASSGLSAVWCQRFSWNDNGSTVSLNWRRWLKSGDEPSTWDLSITDSSLINSPGALGIMCNFSANFTRVFFWSYGTDGDPAPTGPVGGARRRSPLMLTPW